MNEVKISFNKQTWSGDGTYFRGCFTLNKKLFNKFISYLNDEHKVVANKRVKDYNDMNRYMYLYPNRIEKDKWTGRVQFFMKITQTLELIKFLKKEGVNFNIDRACGSFNYYIEVK